jgi:hypothetical protein
MQPGCWPPGEMLPTSKACGEATAMVSDVSSSTASPAFLSVRLTPSWFDLCLYSRMRTPIDLMESRLPVGKQGTALQTQGCGSICH